MGFEGFALRLHQRAAHRIVNRARFVRLPHAAKTRLFAPERRPGPLGLMRIVVRIETANLSKPFCRNNSLESGSLTSSSRHSRRTVTQAVARSWRTFKSRMAI